MKIKFEFLKEKTELKFKEFMIVGIIFLLFAGLVLGMVFENFEGKVRRLFMGASVEAYNVELEHKHSYHRNYGGCKGYAATYYYIIDGRKFEYSTRFRAHYYTKQMEDLTLYYDLINPNNAVSEYEASFYFRDLLFVFPVGFIILVGVVLSIKIKFK